MKILFIGPDYYLFRDNLVPWINQYTAHRAFYNDGCSDPDVVVGLHRLVNKRMLSKFSTTPKTVFYAMGYLVWGQEIDEFFDHVFAYGDFEDVRKKWEMTKQIDFLPLPVDVEKIPKRLDMIDLKICRAFKTVNSLGYIYQKSTFAKKELLDIGKPLTTISDMPQLEYFSELGKHNLLVGNFSSGRIGKTEIEAMAAGIACIAWIRPETQAMFETLGANFPIIQATKETFSDIYQGLTLEKINRIGSDSRSWILSNYTNSKIANYWVTNLAQLKGE